MVVGSGGLNRVDKSGESLGSAVAVTVYPVRSDETTLGVDTPRHSQCSASRIPVADDDGDRASIRH